MYVCSTFGPPLPRQPLRILDAIGEVGESRAGSKAPSPAGEESGSGSGSGTGSGTGSGSGSTSVSASGSTTSLSDSAADSGINSLAPSTAQTSEYFGGSQSKISLAEEDKEGKGGGYLQRGRPEPRQAVTYDVPISSTGTSITGSATAGASNPFDYMDVPPLPRSISVPTNTSLGTAAMGMGMGSGGIGRGTGPRTFGTNAI
jgi:hypothetical protein